MVLRILLSLALLWGSSSVWAQCEYPNSERGEAPAWMCDVPEFEGARFLAIGDKSRMPSVSLQSRLAGKAAMAGVVESLLSQARGDLITELNLDLALVLPDSKDWKRVARFKGIKVMDKALSPGRHLYVLAGVPEESQAELLKKARGEVLAANRGALKKALGGEAWQSLKKGYPIED